MLCGHPPATGGWLRVSGGLALHLSNISCAAMISLKNCSRVSTSLFIICCWMAPRLLMLLKFCGRDIGEWQDTTDHMVQSTCFTDGSL
jgi:hypothetical protein